VADRCGRVLIMAGGTGGHVYPALAIARAMQSRGYDVEWLGTSRGLEARVIPETGIKLNTLSVSGLRGKGLIDSLRAILMMPVALIQAFLVVFRYRPGCVLGMGGYAAAPGGLVSWLLRRPLIIHEQNAVAGTTNRLLAPLANRVCAAYPKAFASRENVIEVGNPVRAEIVALRENWRARKEGSAVLNVLVLGGSLGARALNEVVPDALAKLPDGLLQIWHQCGENNLETTAAHYSKLGLEVRLEPYIEDMAAAYAWADIAFCRAGALTCAELAIAGVPSILVPLPGAIDDHQTENARVLERASAAYLMPQSAMDVEALSEILQACAENRENLEHMAEAAFKMGWVDSVDRICGVCTEVFRDY
jgi:UDP-N-acetylglucosamine--N-acetylmuramyl-(pentapeptide) pyrophosphoryl-undecaprenol N-acetylglucosamine transferase